ncbi:5'-nucleotidase [Bacteroides sp.]|uniref:5'-nucleotidase n=1 Tax=Bacteroides sp. TaxID=29523 RepID=UPI002FCAB0CE
MQYITKFFSGVALTGLLIFASCHSSRQAVEITQIKGTLIPVDSLLDARPDAQATALIAPYKAKIDSMMYAVVGESEITMPTGRPESLLSNLIADVLRESAVPVLGKPADMGLVNMGGLRSILSKGPITCGTIYEILPFENSLCVVSVKGTTLKELFTAIAAKKGEGVSGVKLTINQEGGLLNGTIGGKAVEDDKVYTVATIDYLADGNDGMAPLAQAIKRECPDKSILRDLFMDYVKQQTKSGKKITSGIEGRVVINN